VICLDTNVISELVRPLPDPKVLVWIQAQPRSELCTAAVVEAEIRIGLSALPEGARRRRLALQYDQLVFGILPVFPFDDLAAKHCADIVEQRRRLGRPMMFADAQIAAVCVARDLRLATRNRADFTDCGITLIDPFAG
jgi:hypothetical protein